jgi:hypothetical protein
LGAKLPDRRSLGSKKENMTYTKYSQKTGTKIVELSKNDIRLIPFDEIEEEYQIDFAARKESALEAENKAAEYKLKDKYVEITELSPDELDKIRKEANYKVVSAFVEQYGIANKWSWLAHQMLSHIGDQEKLDLCTEWSESGEVPNSIPVRDILGEIIGSDKWELGLYRMMTKVPRSLMMTNQTSPEHLPVCSLVPIYMAAFKKYQNIPYCAWDKDEARFFVEAELYAAMMSPKLPEFVTNEELLSIRDAGLKYTSRGKKDLGQQKSHDPRTYHQLTGINDSGIGMLNRYARAMVTQIWCAHPMNRHKYMILDPWNWDNMPNPLVTTKVLHKKPYDPTETDEAWS